MNGRALHFYLAGINNQNFLMRDKETGTWWQQITGKAIYGPLKGASLELVLSDELTFGEWKSEVSGGRVLAEVPKYGKEYDSNWEPETAKYPVVISFPGTELKSRDVVVGLEMDGPGRAYPWDTLVKQSPVVDRVNGKPLLVAVGPDGKSFRVFVSRIDGKDAEFFLKGEAESESAGTAKIEAKTGDASRREARLPCRDETHSPRRCKTSRSQSGCFGRNQTRVSCHPQTLDTARHHHRQRMELPRLRRVGTFPGQVPGSHPRAERLLVRLAQLPSRHDNLQTLDVFDKRLSIALA